MLHRVLSSFLNILILFILASCAGVDDKAQDIQVPDMAEGIQKFPAWEQQELSAGSTGKSKATYELLYQADRLISNNRLDQASDKLERLLRIEPSSAQAWSRLSWIALENNMPRRSQQMAQRSNSYTRTDKLKALNWFFIRETGFLMGDEEVIKRAEEMIRGLDESLGDSLDDSLSKPVGNY